MVVQAETVPEKNESIELIQIPEDLPDEILKHDVLLAIESSMNKLEDKVVTTARTVLTVTSELKTQITEIERLENTITGMHEFIVQQNNRIHTLEDQLENTKKRLDEHDSKDKNTKGGFWARWFTLY